MADAQAGMSTRPRAGDPYAPPEGEYISIAALILALWRRKWLVLAVTTLCAVLAGVAALLMKPVYRGAVLVSPIEQESADLVSSLANQFGGLASAAGITGGGRDTAAQLFAVLQSRRIAEEFIAQNDLIPLLFADKWDAAAGAWAVDDDEEPPTMDDAYVKFNEEVRSVSEDTRTGLVTLSVFWHDRNQAAEWANELIALVNRSERQRAINVAQRSIEYLNQQLEETNIVEVRQSIFGLIETQIKTIMLANVKDEYAYRVLDPAVVPDEERYARPQRLLIVALGVLGGFGLGVLLVMFLEWRGTAGL